jgi:hypothetical protein
MAQPNLVTRPTWARGHAGQRRGPPTLRAQHRRWPNLSKRGCVVPAWGQGRTQTCRPQQTARLAFRHTRASRLATAATRRCGPLRQVLAERPARWRPDTRPVCMRRRAGGQVTPSPSSFDGDQGWGGGWARLGASQSSAKPQSKAHSMSYWPRGRGPAPHNAAGQASGTMHATCAAARGAGAGRGGAVRSARSRHALAGQVILSPKQPRVSQLTSASPGPGFEQRSLGRALARSSARGPCSAFECAGTLAGACRRGQRCAPPASRHACGALLP